MVTRPKDTTKGSARLAGEKRHAWHQRLTRNLRERNHAGGRKPLDNVELMHELAKIVHIEVEAEAKQEIAEARADAKAATLRAVLAQAGGVQLSLDALRAIVEHLEREAL